MTTQPNTPVDSSRSGVTGGGELTHTGSPSLGEMEK